ncbi:MAG: hypothetical protein M3P14_00835 [Chloroflexota bacterium]|nr:hypothetical protein [Chloroflexota bacterium]
MGWAVGRSTPAVQLNGFDVPPDACDGVNAYHHRFGQLEIHGKFASQLGHG